ncbi:MAG TPA: hypothetical protein VEW74_05210, partial [Candidatus Nitrosotalea sp.]|nr:hypothetical protein [Candidatus Nitrosotalea sp.]
MSFTTELRVPPELAFASLIEVFVADAASRCDFTERKRHDAVAAARVGFAAIVDEALAESREPVRIVARCTPVHFELSLFERGLPIDDALARRNPKWSELAALVDEAHWHLHGTGGSELRLFVKRCAPAGAADSAGDRAPTEVTPAPPQRYMIRRFQPRDAEGVARAFYLTYGYAYDMPAVYAPARLTELNESGRYASIVALDEGGEVVGHYALAREGEAPIADACGAIVVPAHRGRDLLNRLRERAEREAIALGLAAYYSEPVTDHPRTQAASESFGAKACGITLGEAPRGFLARHMRLAATTPRQSCMLYVKVLRAREPRTIYAPERHRAILSRIYAELGLPITVGRAVAPSGRGEFRSAIVRADAV